MLNNCNTITRPALAFCAALLFCGFMQDERVFLSPDKKFSIEFPARLVTPAEGTEMGEEEGISMMVWATQMTSSGAFVLMYSDSPEFPDSPDEEFRSQVFQSMYEGFLSTESAHYEILSERGVKSGEFFGREFKATGVLVADSSRFFSNAQIFIAGKRTYLLVMTNKSREIDSVVSTRFFNSFKILKK